MDKHRSSLFWWPEALLGLIVAFYIALAVAYALKTPLWQAPDEPAHYNYIVHLAEKRSLPLLMVGDYPHQYLEEIKAARFPPEMSIEPIRYESHQPPLYYLLATPAYWLGGLWGLEGRVAALRLFSLALGAGVLLAIYRTVREIFPRPEEAILALGAAGFAAAIPMRLAMSAAITNDGLAELLMALVLLAAVRMATGKEVGSVQVGVLLGAVLLTKTTIYLPAIVLVALGRLFSSQSKARVARSLLISYGLMLILAAGWFIRNGLTYGWDDILVWSRHDLVVVGQPRAESLGLAWTKRLLVIGFKSFWAQFGWMGIPISERIYAVLGAGSLVLGLGFVLYALRVARFGGLARQELNGLALNLALVVLVAGEFLGYNLKFIQPQGRYLFPAIGAIGLGASLGLRELVNPRYERAMFALLYLGLLGLDAWCLWGVIVPYFR